MKQRLLDLVIRSDTNNIRARLEIDWGIALAVLVFATWLCAGAPAFWK
jgi:hypothetical protein